jgi:hypothetical protein
LFARSLAQRIGGIRRAQVRGWEYRLRLTMIILYHNAMTTADSRRGDPALLSPA